MVIRKCKIALRNKWGGVSEDEIRALESLKDTAVAGALLLI